LVACGVGVGAGIGSNGLVIKLFGRTETVGVGVGVGVGETLPPELGENELIEKVIEVVLDPDVEPVPVIVIVSDEAAVGVPEITPVDVFNVNPAGSEPLVTAYVTVPVNPDPVNAEDGVIGEFIEPEMV